MNNILQQNNIFTSCHTIVLLLLLLATIFYTETNVIKQILVLVTRARVLDPGKYFQPSLIFLSRFR